jgi:hypothetical protein
LVQIAAEIRRLGDAGRRTKTPSLTARPDPTTRLTLGVVGLIGAGEGIRTLDPDLGKVVLYP